MKRTALDFLDVQVDTQTMPSHPLPRISIITAVRNSVETIDECLGSIAIQSYRNIEHIVVDGASTDGTLNVLAGHHPQIDVLVSEPDAGIYEALNKGLALATGEIIGFLHADDVYAGPSILQDIAAAFSDPLVGAVYGDLQYVRKNDLNRVVRHWNAGHFTQNRLAWGWMPPHPTLYVRRKWYDRVGSFDLKYQIAADYYSILRLFSHIELNPVHLPKVMVKMRIGGLSNRSLATIVQKSREDLDALNRSGVGGLHTLMWKNLSKIRQLLVSS